MRKTLLEIEAPDYADDEWRERVLQSIQSSLPNCTVRMVESPVTPAPEPTIAQAAKVLFPDVDDHATFLKEVACDCGSNGIRIAREYKDPVEARTEAKNAGDRAFEVGKAAEKAKRWIR